VYSLRPRVIALSLLPLVLMAALSLTVAWFFWEPAMEAVQVWLGEWALLESLLRWLDSVNLGHLRMVIAPLLVLMLALPIMVVLILLAVAWFMTPAIVRLVAERRFPALTRQRGGSFWRSVLLGAGAALLAALALILSLPLWLIPPLAMVLPPLIWGWLTFRVMVFDVLAEHASAEERRELQRRHRLSLLAIGLLTGYLGAAPAMIWAIGAMAIVFAPLLLPLAIWIYTFVFAFSSLWFAHFCLAALAALRTEASMPAPAAEAGEPALLTQDSTHDQHPTL
jgi:hypothetical protein